MLGLGGLRSSGKGAVLGAKTSAVWGAVGVRAAQICMRQEPGVLGLESQQWQLLSTLGLFLAAKTGPRGVSSPQAHSFSVSVWHKIAASRQKRIKTNETPPPKTPEAVKNIHFFCSKYLLFSPGVIISSQCLDISLKHYSFPTLSPKDRLLQGGRGGDVTLAWPISISHWLGLCDWFKDGPGSPAGPIRVYLRTFVRTSLDP